MLRYSEATMALPQLQAGTRGGSLSMVGQDEILSMWFFASAGPGGCWEVWGNKSDGLKRPGT